jgi:hypothetical protein
MLTIQDIFGKTLHCKRRVDVSWVRQKEKEETNCGERCKVQQESVQTLTRITLLLVQRENELTQWPDNVLR